MAPPLIQLTGIHLSFGGAPLLDGVDLSVAPGERVCLVGRNGSGKSTLLKIAAGLVNADGGQIFVHPGATIRYLPQEPDFSGHATALAHVEAGLAPGDEPYRARYMLDQLDVAPEADPRHLSGGEARRVALARALAPEPDVLLLDEPTNHLDLPTIEWLEKELARRRGALILISHDRRFLSNLSRTTIWLDRGRTRRVEMGFATFEAWRDEVLAEEERDAHKLDRRIKAEEHWLRYGVTARRKRNVGRLARLQSMRQDRRDARKAPAKATLSGAEAERSGSLVIEAEGVSKAYDGRPVVAGFSCRIKRGDRIGIVGPNGAGKSTLLKVLTGTEAPDAGRVTLGTNLEIASLDQGRQSLDPETTLRDALTGGHGDLVLVAGQPKHVIGYMKDFLFTPEQADSPLRVLSGGERARLMLARALARPSNLLLLDEPTNDLDLETLDVLEETLGDYSGTVILISHDRDFLDRAVERVIAPEGDGVWREYAGGYSDLLAQRGAEPSAPGRTRATQGAPAAPATDATPPKPSRRKLSFNEKHALETLPSTIADLERRIARHQKVLEDPGLFARDRAGFDRASAGLAADQAALAQAEERWLELEILRAEIEGG